MSIKKWQADLRAIDDDAEYHRIFNLLNDISEGRGMLPTPFKKVFTVLLDAEENAGLLRGLDQYLSRIPPER